MMIIVKTGQNLLVFISEMYSKLNHKIVVSEVAKKGININENV